ncbi:MAG: IclR family transcriptional regulator [Acidimicrobiales bacterium]
MVNGLKVLEALASQQPIGVSRLARELGMPKSTVQRCLLTLEDAGWIQAWAEGETRWTLTTKALTIGRRASPELGLREAALPVMHDLSQQTDETVYLTVREGYGSVLVERLDSTQAVRTYLPLGTRGPLHGPSTGKAILAHLGPTELDDVLARGLERYTERTLCQPARLRKELEKIRADGYAVNIGEWRKDVAGIGAPVFNANGTPIAAISISLPVTSLRTGDVPALGAQLVAAVRLVEKHLHGSTV